MFAQRECIRESTFGSALMTVLDKKVETEENERSMRKISIGRVCSWLDSKKKHDKDGQEQRLIEEKEKIKKRDGDK